MTKQRHIGALMTAFSVITGFVIGALTWLYLKASNVGITLIWNKIGGFFPTAVYTLIVCLIGGVIIGLYQKRFGPCPENMGDAVRRVMRDRDYPYRDMPIAIIAALLSLLFGGAVGPEGGLVCILLSLVFWARDEFGMARYNMQINLEAEPGISGRRIFGRMLRGLFSNPFRIAYEKGRVSWSRSLQIACGVGAGLGGLFVYVLFCLLFGTVFNLPHLDGGAVQTKDQLIMILLFVVGIAAGYLYLILKKVTEKIFSLLEGKGLQVLNAVLGGLILGLIGGRLPCTMFSGGTDIQTIFTGAEELPTMASGNINFQTFQYEYFSAVPIVLIVIGVLKLFLTNVCISSGWRGGHFFPLLFAGLSIGYGFAGLFGTNEILSIVVVTGALLGTVLQQPIGALALSVLFFPLRELGWMIAVTFVSGCIPLPTSLRRTPETKGFIYNTIHRKERKQIPME